MSYLRGPLTRDQISSLMNSSGGSAAPAAPVVAAPAVVSEQTDSAPVAAAPVASAPAPATTIGDDETPVMPAVASGIPIVYVDPSAGWLPEVGGVAGGVHLRCAAVARVNLRYTDTPSNTILDEEYEAVLMPLPQIPDGRMFVDVDYDDRDFISTVPAGAVYELIPAEAKNKTYWTALQKALVDELQRSQTTDIFVNPDLKTYARVGETQDEFVVRCHDVAEEFASKATAALRDKYQTKLAAAQSKATDAQITANQYAQEFESNYGLSATVGNVLGGLLGGRRTRTQMAADAKREKAMRAKADASIAKAQVAGSAVYELQQKLNDDILAIDAEWGAKAQNITTKSIPLAKSDITVTDFRCVWIPVG